MMIRLRLVCLLVVTCTSALAQSTQPQDGAGALAQSTQPQADPAQPQADPPQPEADLPKPQADPAGGAVAVDQPAGAVAPGDAVQPNDAAAPDGAAVDPRVVEILTRLQARSDGLKDIRCKVRFVEDDRINLSKRTKHGQISFLLTKPNPLSMIQFDRVEMDGVLGRREWYLFEGRWLYEALERLEQVTKRELVPEGETIDLFDLESAPFPLPFGQKKEAILRHFYVTLAPPAEGDPADTDHLVCTPKPESKMARRYDKLEFYVRKDIHLPSRIVVTKNDGLEVSTADFPDLSEKSINTGVGPKDFAKPAEWKKYKLVVEELPPAEKGAP